MIAYKLLRKRKNGTLGPLFINARQVIPLGQWLTAEAHDTPGYAFHPGWHCTRTPHAPHLSTKGRVWCRVEVEKYEKYDRPESQGGVWFLAQRMLVLEELTPELAEALRDFTNGEWGVLSGVGEFLDWLLNRKQFDAASLRRPARRQLLAEYLIWWRRERGIGV